MMRHCMPQGYTTHSQLCTSHWPLTVAKLTSLSASLSHLPYLRYTASSERYTNRDISTGELRLKLCNQRLKVKTATTTAVAKCSQSSGTVRRVAIRITSGLVHCSVICARLTTAHCVLNLMAPNDDSKQQCTMRKYRTNSVH